VRVRQRTALLSAPNDSGQPAPPRSPTDSRAEDVRPLRRLDVVNGVPVEQTPKQGLRRRILGDAGGPAVRYEARVVHETDVGRGGGLLQGLPQRSVLDAEGRGLSRTRLGRTRLGDRASPNAPEKQDDQKPNRSI
jgi:hypothetical protein